MDKEGLKNNSEDEAVEIEVGAVTEAETTTTVSGQDEVTSLKQQLEEQKNDYLRLAAEFDNFRKRTRRDTADIIRSANESLIIQLLDVLDNFDRAMKSREENVDFETYSKGVALVYDKLNSILSNAGLKRFESLGEPFDPRLHEALLQVEADDKEPDTVANELSPGYTLNDKVIRHAKVGVTKKKEEN
ncbi:MAG: nucleotide exchange factor GrpE [bacterium]|nr:nucleotide exchange factor GrpE [bacterium]